MGQNNDPKEHGDLQGQQGVVRKMPQSQPAQKPEIKSRDGVAGIAGGEADIPDEDARDLADFLSAKDN